jgi:hypothetical protein
MAFVTKHTTRVVENNYYMVTRKEMGKRAKLLLSFGSFFVPTLCCNCVWLGALLVVNTTNENFQTRKANPANTHTYVGGKGVLIFKTSFFFKALKKQNSEETRPRGAVVLE